MKPHKYIATIHEYLNENNSIDIVLDKINKYGIDSLTKFEKDILLNTDANLDIEDITTLWLKSKYSNLHIIEDNRKTFGKDKKYILFLNDDMEVQFEYDISDRKLYISYEDVRKYLGEYFDEYSFKRWFYEEYDIDVVKIGNFFKNIE